VLDLRRAQTHRLGAGHHRIAVIDDRRARVRLGLRRARRASACVTSSQ
jgi:hypothetical protein